MEKGKTDLSRFSNTWYKPGGTIVGRMLWYLLNLACFRSGLPFMMPKRLLLRLFGAKIGKGLIIKPHVSIKFPWKLETGDHCWIGEGVWIDNLDMVRLGSNVCISQGAILLCGNHNYSIKSFELMVKPIVIENGAWIGAKSVVCQGVTVGQHAVLSVGSVASQSLDPYGIYRGNPAVKVKERTIL
jgi:putative colanic acid biosynthesis acetyltransferase WcaF